MSHKENWGQTCKIVFVYQLFKDEIGACHLFHCYS
jgi:hypothetical protein